MAERTASASAAGTNTTHLSSTGPDGAGSSTSRTRNPSADASAALSALVWAVNKDRPVRIIEWISAPLAESADTESTPRSSNGWCASRSPPSGTRATVSAVASTATVTDVTLSAGSPHTRPTESQLWARCGG